MIIRSYSAIAISYLLLSYCNTNAMIDENNQITTTKKRYIKRSLVELTLQDKLPEDYILRLIHEGKLKFNRANLCHRYVSYGDKPGFIRVHESGKYNKLMSYLWATEPYSTWLKNESRERLRTIIFPHYMDTAEQLQVKLEALKSTPEELKKWAEKAESLYEDGKIRLKEFNRTNIFLCFYLSLSQSERELLLKKAEHLINELTQLKSSTKNAFPKKLLNKNFALRPNH